MNTAFELRLGSRQEEIRPARHAVEAFGRTAGMPEAVVSSLDLILEEWLTNVIKHAYPDATEHIIGIRLNLEADAATLRIEDDGLPFDPLSQPPPDTNTPLAERPIGGLGIFMIRRTADEVEYRRHQDRNTLLVRMRLPPTRETAPGVSAG